VNEPFESGEYGDGGIPHLVSTVWKKDNCYLYLHWNSIPSIAHSVACRYANSARGSARSGIKKTNKNIGNKPTKMVRNKEERRKFHVREHEISNQAYIF
jgi:hypothetical protein